ncbi:prephenate dehydrogenase/arogenate dehydrogenase family protein [Thiospirochaeta perfilievii]|uniref:Prephenate dehydrogenase/arogenate dehydrogenase family protein n=1 Tax=Thiospirochaeta perfilievii TaxID=252967 RepID=A0A5C1QGM9_9SPIO|nr:prephenate dehydrogenase/arogenate dehydrogenase family protein [Thiospirochaeta perfilievii]QEN05726.1 prephenate dehydrogenase/arogenate dehydrogenase family protein [Thiospirochaeta perfilievii]
MTIGIYGLGRFGVFWGDQLSKVATVKGYSRNSSRVAPSTIKRVSEDEVLSCDVIVICVAISAMESFLHNIKDRVKPGTLIMDTCSVKVHPIKLMLDLLPSSVDIIGTHPMFGPDSGRFGIAGLPIVVSEVRVDKSKYNKWIDLFNSLNLSVIEMTPQEHDREAAYTQGITHFIGRTLSDLHLKNSAISTSGYNSLLEIIKQTCNDEYQLFLDLQKYNSYTSDMRRDLKSSLNKVLGVVEAEISDKER